jgi:hypothetical protein
MAKRSIQSLKTITEIVKLHIPPKELPFEFLSKRVNTEMYYCGDVESVEIDDEMTKITLALGNLTLLLDNNLDKDFPFPVETLLNKNVCVGGYLTVADVGFKISIKSSTQIWLSGH